LCDARVPDQARASVDGPARAVEAWPRVKERLGDEDGVAGVAVVEPGRA
jgi:hypothetical protein